MDATGFAILTVLGFAVLFLPARQALLALIVGALFLTQGQSFQPFGFSFTPIRTLCYLAFFRVLIRRELQMSNWTSVDSTLIVLYLYMTFVLLTRPEEPPSLRIAKMMDVFAAYFSFRSLVRSPEDFLWSLKVLVLLLVPYVGLLAIESFTHRNPFAVVGGNTAPWSRGDRLRCFGSFRHPSLLGSVGATFFPLYVSLALDSGTRRNGVLGAILCTLVVLFSNSGGPLSAWTVGVVGWFLWPMRMHMKKFRWVSVIGIMIISLFMTAPVWYLLARISGVTGGTGWHRSYLIDVFIRNIEKWWLVGMPIKDTSRWFGNVIHSTGGADITNQYISFGLNAGLICIGLFLYLLYRLFSFLGRARAAASSLSDGSRSERLVWGLGVMLAVHVSNWLGIAYWDQFNVVWLFQLGCIVSVTSFYFNSALSESLSPPMTPDDGVEVRTYYHS